MNSICIAALEPPRHHIPLFAEHIPAGFPSPAADYIEDSIDLNELLVRDVQATFFLRVQGESMSGAGITDGSVVVVDAGMTPIPGDIVVAEINGGFTLKRLRRVGGLFELHPDNPEFKPIQIPDGGELRIFGVVTGCVMQFKR